MNLKDLKRKMQSKKFKRHAYFYLNSFSDQLTDSLIDKCGRKLAFVPLRFALRTAYSYIDNWCDGQIDALNSAPVIITNNFAPVAKFIEKVTSSDTPFSNLTVLLHGRPGTGKSFFVTMAEAASASHETMDLRSNVLYMAESMMEKKSNNRGGSGIQDCASSRTRYSGRRGIDILYLNEVDRYLEDPLLQAGLLEALDAPKRDMSRKSVTFLTTNHIDKIPEVLRRPGRIDLIIEVQGMTEEEAKGLMKLYGFEGAMPEKNSYGLYSPAEIYAHMRAHAKLFE